MNSPRENDDSFDDLNTNRKRPLQSRGLAFNTAFATNASRLYNPTFFAKKSNILTEKSNSFAKYFVP